MLYAVIHTGNCAKGILLEHKSPANYAHSFYYLKVSEGPHRQREKTHLLPFIETVSFDDHIHQDHMISSCCHFQTCFPLLYT